MKADHLKHARSDLFALLVAAGWPAGIGINDKARVCRNRVALDGAVVHTFWTKGRPFFAYDPALKLVASGENRDVALAGMVAARDFGTQGRGARAVGRTSGRVDVSCGVSA